MTRTLPHSAHKEKPRLSDAKPGQSVSIYELLLLRRFNYRNHELTGDPLNRFTI